MELLIIYKISPHPSLLKRGREKAEMTHSVTRRAKFLKFVIYILQLVETLLINA